MSQINNCDSDNFTRTSAAFADSISTSQKKEGTGSLKIAAAKQQVYYACVGSGRNNIGTISEKHWTQTFTAISEKIDQVAVNVGTGSAGANLVIKLYADDGNGKPSGSALKTVSIASGSLNHEAETIITFAVTGLTISTRYVIEFSDANTASDDHYKMLNNSGGSTPSGQKCWKWNGSSWTDVTSSIHNFYLKVIDNSGGEYVYFTPTNADFSNFTKVTFWARCTRTGALSRVQMGESGDEDQHSQNITIGTANTWELQEWDISGIAAANRNAIDTFGFEVIDDTNDFDLYIDDIRTPDVFVGMV